MESWAFFTGVPGPQRVLKALTGSLGLSSLTELYNPTTEVTTHRTCAKEEVSCQTRYSGQDTCCFNYPGGQLLQTQFWDTDPALGPDDSWTIHGLWPDHCDGGFDQFCDSRRHYNNISLILVDSGRRDLLEYMDVYWKDFKGDDLDLWVHEWNKHGTCISTLETRCYDEYYPQQDVVDYFDKAVEIFGELPSYKFLADAGIVPSHTKTYTLAEIEDALAKGHGSDVTVRCHSHSLNEIWYHFNVAGTLQTGDFVPSSPDGLKSNCPTKGVRYQPKRSQPEPTNTATKTARPTATPGIPFQGQGNLKVSTQGSGRGCIISYGTWFSSGTCATFRGEKVRDGTFTLTSSRGKCSFEQDILTCGAHIDNPMEFEMIDGKLAYNGNTTFYADKPPKGYTQSDVFATQGEHPVELDITWKERE
ncbi:T2 family ribonuclease [Aspergillus glaucus CBS 516.65]|uniref:Ribonuclease T2-like n=1 Tax=Aspergillus glaucus CBS 516.65 TaxID=1160497 RepID=A0A1L9VNT7_ASPGL|nr:hypothetical protein ASPGLDRAFT_24604 [Aspergillus glaucus CBS 516.65]OJJ85588.1 hypothetical protein ASPGLDRAFT_24604 [Aspergillus glaucus CBS 516.65]